jgi:hypothetical protein
MTVDYSNPQELPDQDQILDRRLAALGSFAPSAGFADRVMARVRIPAPLAAASARPVRRRRWPALVGPLAGVSAASSTALTVWTASHFGAIAAWSVTSVTAVTVSIWHTALSWLAGSSASLGSAVLTEVFRLGGTPLIWTAAIANLAVPVSLIGLVMTARPYLRKSAHVAR